MATPKFLYERTYSVVRITPERRQSVVLDHHPSKSAANRLAVAASNNAPGRVFKVKEYKAVTGPNPEYWDLDSSTSRQNFVDTGQYLTHAER